MLVSKASIVEIISMTNVISGNSKEKVENLREHAIDMKVLADKLVDNFVLTPQEGENEVIAQSNTVTADKGNIRQMNRVKLEIA